MEKAPVTVRTETFMGLASGMDAHDLQPGQATIQLNVRCIRAGELTLRGGLQELVFDEDSGG